jgi:hypothetical protein
MKKSVKKAEVKTALVLRTCSSDMSSQNNFVWPAVGENAVCPDWINNTECGNGLHGWLYGQGDYSSSSYLDETAKWLVVEVELAGVVMLGGKCKFEKGIVRFVGDKKSATDYLMANEPNSQNGAVIGASITKGKLEYAVVGAFGTATAGDSGTATAGDSGTATAGDRGTATAGDRGTATAGDSGEIRIRYWDSKADRYRTKIAYVGEDGIEANVAYRLDDKLNFVKA